MKTLNPVSRSIVAFLTFSFSLSAVQADSLIGTGASGADGIDGTNYSTSPRSNNRGEVKDTNQCQATNGRHGTHGTDAGPGSRGSDFDLSISDDGQILVLGTETQYLANGSKKLKISERTAITGVLQVSSRGGKGGTPGKGGNGEGAQSGQDSKDHSTNEDLPGGDGCDASKPGNGGNSGTPGDGGDGGLIRFKLSSEDTHLLLALSVDTRAGQPGDRLDGGNAGSRASGGDGANGFYEDRSGEYPTGRMVNEKGCTPRKAGDYGTGRYKNEPGCTPTSGQYVNDGEDCDWVTTTAGGIEKTEYVCEPKTKWVAGVTCDQVEITEYLSEIKCRQVPETQYKKVIVRTEKGKNGKDSPSAKDGKSSPDTAVPGKAGGAIFEVTDAQTGQVQTYTTRDFMDLEMLDYDLVEEDQNGVLDQGETVHLQNLRIRNRGKIPYAFTKAQTLVFLKTSNWLVADPQTLTIPKVGAGETIVIKNPNLKFTIRSNSFQANSSQPIWEDTIVPHNQITRIERKWDGLNLSKSFYITFPVRMTSFEVPRTIQAGESVQISWSVQNLSKRDIPELGAFARSIRTDLNFESEHLSQDQISILMDGSKTKDLSGGLVQMVSGLKANETRVIKGILSVDSAVEPYSVGELNLGLHINRLKEDHLIEIQKLNARIQVTRVYKTQSKDDVLLVLTESNRQIFRSWAQLFKRMGLQANIWDLSIDGGFSFFGALSGGGNLSKDFKNKSVILPKLTDHGAVNYLLQEAHNELFEAASQMQNSVYLIGHEANYVQALMAKSLKTQNTIQHKSVENFFASLQKGYKRSAGEVDEISVEESYFFVRKPRTDKLFEAKALVEDYLKRTYPDRHFGVSLDYDPKLISNSVKATYRLGKLLVREGLDYDKSKLVLLPSKMDPYSTQFIQSTQNIHALCLALNPQARLKALDASVANKEIETLKAILNCIQYDIYQEWMSASKKLKRTDYYLNYLRPIYLKADGSVRSQIIGFAAYLLTMAESGFSNDLDFLNHLKSQFLSQFKNEDLKKIESTAKEIKAKIKTSADKTKRSSALITKKVILKTVNPNAQTTGINADDLTQ